jgi:tellurite resistance protein
VDDRAQLALVFRTAVLAAFAGGKPGAEEIKVIRELVALHPSFASLPAPQDQVIATVKELKDKGMEALLDELATGLTGREYQELAFRMCARVTSADGETGGEEAMLLGELQERFAFSPDYVKRLLAAR